MERADESQRVLPFQLQFEKPVASQIKLAEWNPEKDLLAMVTDDSKIVLHRFNWQRLWTISPGKCITSLCWSPDGKAIAVGVEDGTVSLHDVENGKLLRSVKSHNAAVSCLHWEEEEPVDSRDCGSISYEDRTTRFFPPAPRVPRMPGLVSGDSGFIDDNEDSFRELSSSSHQRFNILCSGDKDGSICFCIFGIFPIGKINIRELYVSRPNMEEQFAYHLLDSSISKVALSKDLSHLTIICSGALVRNDSVSRGSHSSELGLVGLHSLVLDTSIFWKRKNELHQVAQQASNIKDLSEVVRVSLSIMQKQWYDAMHTFHEKFSSLSTLIIDNGLDSSPKEELLSLLGGARVSSAVHQFLVNSLGEAGVKRVSKTISATGKELQLIVLDHLQPAAEVIGFRIGELRGLSKWRSRFKGVGLDEKLINNATERAGMLLIQVERFMRVLSSVVQQFTNFFNWLLKCIKMLMSEPSDQLPPFNSELVILFLKFLYDQDPVGHLLELAENIEVDLETTQRVGELSQFGGFTDSKFLRRTLAKEFDQMEASFKEAFLMPFTMVSEKICCKDFLPLFPCASPPMLVPIEIPTTISYYKDGSQAFPNHQANGYQYIDYISFRTPDGSDLPNCIGVARGFIHDSASTKKGYSSLEVVFLHVPDGYHCVDLSLYKESQMVLLLNESTSSAESSGNAVLMILQAGDLPFLSLSRSTSQISWTLKELKDAVVHLQMENEKFRLIPHSVITPLAVSASRGVACVFTGRKRALVYILEEDEEENSDEESE